MTCSTITTMPSRRALLLAVVLVSHGIGCGQPAPLSPDAFSPDAFLPDDAPTGDASGAELLVERFEGEGTTWPVGWTALGGVASATRTLSRGLLVPVVSSYSLARMAHVLPTGSIDVSATFYFSMTDADRQGVGFYVRQNGGYLRQTAIHGAGYAVFVEAFRGGAIGLWRERDGVEEELVRVPATIVNDAVYRVDFTCIQRGAATELSARMVRADGLDPSLWTVTTTDATPELQNLDGAVAIDAWNTATPGAGPPPGVIFVDDVEVLRP